MAPPMAADALGRPAIVMADLVGEVTGSWGEDPPDVGLVELAGGVGNLDWLRVVDGLAVVSSGGELVTSVVRSHPQ